MAIITNITEQKNKKRANIFIDGSFFCGLNLETMIKNGIKTGMSVNEKELPDIVIESETRHGLDYCFKLLAVKPYSRHEIIKKLENKGYDEGIIQNILYKLEEYKLFDDLAYAKAIIEGSKNDGKRKIMQKLINKGITTDILKELDSMFVDEKEKGKLASISAKYMKNKPHTQQILQKLYKYLLGKGFDYELIKFEIEKYRENDNESWY